MKTKRDKDYYLARATKGFKTLVIYYSVTRPQYEKAYHKDGKFSTDELLKQLAFLDEWKNRSKRERQLLAYKYAEYARTFNYTFSIPSELVNKVLGEYRDEQGRLVRIRREEVVDKLVRDGYIKVLNHGSKTRKGEDGKIHKTCYWDKKYLLANKDYWLTLLADSRYSDYTKYPIDDDCFVMRAVRIIAKYRKQTMPQKKVEAAKPKEKETSNSTNSSFRKRLISELAEGLARGLVNECSVESQLAMAKFSQNEIDVLMPKMRKFKARYWKIKARELVQNGQMELDELFKQYKIHGQELCSEEEIKVKKWFEENYNIKATEVQK